MNNTPEYKIHGLERRQLKKELAKLKHLYKTFWYYHNLDKDMAVFFGGSAGYPMSDEKAKERHQEISEEIKSIQLKLQEPYGNS